MKTRNILSIGCGAVAACVGAIGAGVAGLPALGVLCVAGAAGGAAGAVSRVTSALLADPIKKDRGYMSFTRLGLVAASVISHLGLAPAASVYAGVSVAERFDGNKSIGNMPVLTEEFKGACDLQKMQEMRVLPAGCNVVASPKNGG